MTDSGAEVMDLLLSITSTSIRRVSIVHKPLTPTYSVNWRDFNNPLCQLVDRSGGKHEVEVGFRFKDARAMELEVDELTGELKVVSSLAKIR